MEVNNKIRTASVDQYCGTFPKYDWPEILTHSSTTCLESPYKILGRSNGWIENYNCCRKPGLLRFLRQNPNLTLLGSYHKAAPYQMISPSGIVCVGKGSYLHWGCPLNAPSTKLACSMWFIALLGTYPKHVLLRSTCYKLSPSVHFYKPKNTQEKQDHLLYSQG
jgi:hypothetical protein